MVDRDNIVPMYKQISNYLTNHIIEGKYEKGDKVPTEIELMDKFGVSRTTVRLAVEQLLEKGLVQKRPGKGTFVTNDKVYHQLNEFKSLYGIFLDSNIEVETKLINFDYIKMPNKNIYEKLNVTSEDKLLKVTRVYLIDDKPIAYAEIFIHPDYNDIISEKEAKVHPIYQIIEKEASLKIDYASFEIFSQIPNQKISDFMQIKEGSPILGIERVLYANNNPIEYVVANFQSEKFRFKLTVPSGDTTSRSEMIVFKMKD